MIWITGASSGVGKALAIELSQYGAKLILSSRNQAALEQTKQSCQAANSHLIIPLNLEDTSHFDEKVQEVLSHCHRIDILINNAGITQRSLVKETELEVDRRIMEVNFFGTVALTKAVLPTLLEQREGRIIVVSSVVGLFSTPLRSSYSASKHALHGFFNALRAEVHDEGIKVQLVCLGAVNTNISLNALTGDGSRHGVMDQLQLNAMSAEQCARKIIRAIKVGNAQTIIAKKEKLVVYLHRFFPSWFNVLIRKIKST